MKRVLVAFLLVATASIVHAATPDPAKTFQHLWDTNAIHKGLNLIVTYPNGHKLFADVKSESGNAIVNWVLTDGAGKTIPTVILDRNGKPRMAAMSEEGDCRICDPDGKNCKPGPCPKRVPCCRGNCHFCCLDPNCKPEPH